MSANSISTQDNLRTGGQVLIDQLAIHGVDMAFCVPGESYLAALDAFYDKRDQMKLIVCRQEGGAAYMADAYGKLTGKPGICFVTRGPGATNAAVGVHTFAMLAATSIVTMTVYRWVGLEILRSEWINLDLVWMLVLLVTGAVLSVSTNSPRGAATSSTAPTGSIVFT